MMRPTSRSGLLLPRTISGGGGTPPTLIDTTATENAGNVTKPSGGTSGDYYIVFLTEEGGSKTTQAISGFTKIASFGSSDANSSAYYKSHSGSEGSTFSFTNVSSYHVAEAALVRGSDTPVATTPERVEASNATQTIASYTLLEPALVLVDYTSYFGSAPNNATCTNTDALDEVQASQSSYIWHKTFSSSGSTGSFVITRVNDAASQHSTAGLVICYPV